jgi:hypothetical protein
MFVTLQEKNVYVSFECLSFPKLRISGQNFVFPTQSFRFSYFCHNCKKNVFPSMHKSLLIVLVLNPGFFVTEFLPRFWSSGNLKISRSFGKKKTIVKISDDS